MPEFPRNVGGCFFAGKDNLVQKFPFASKDIRDLKAKEEDNRLLSGIQIPDGAGSKKWVRDDKTSKSGKNPFGIR